MHVDICNGIFLFVVAGEWLNHSLSSGFGERECCVFVYFNIILRAFHFVHVIYCFFKAVPTVCALLNL